MKKNANMKISHSGRYFFVTGEAYESRLTHQTDWSPVTRMVFLKKKNLTILFEDFQVKVIDSF